MYLQLGNRQITGSEGILKPADVSGSLGLQLPENVKTPLTLVIYDKDAPYPERPSDSPYIHFLVINMRTSDILSGNRIFDYVPPNPPSDSPPHRYTALLYTQREPYTRVLQYERDRFPLQTFIDLNNGGLVERLQFQVEGSAYEEIVPRDHETRSIRAPLIPSIPAMSIVPRTSPPSSSPRKVSPIYSSYDAPSRRSPRSSPRSSTAYDDPPPTEVPTSSPTSSPRFSPRTHRRVHHEEFVNEEGLTEQQAKFCSCLPQVIAKDTKGTVKSPYAICAKSTGTSLGRHSCLLHYDFDNMPDDLLRATLNLHKVALPVPYTREEAIRLAKAKAALAK
jgi:hypothetical protein